MVPLTDIEQRRARLLASVCLVLAAFSLVLVAFSLLGPKFIAPLQFAPAAARVGVLILTIGLIALVWEKERQFKRLFHAVSSQNVLIASFENRIRVVETMLEVADRLNAPMAVDDILRIVIDAAVDLVGAEGGTIVFEEGDGDLMLSQSHSSEPDLASGKVHAKLPLVSDEHHIGTLTLTFPMSLKGFDQSTLDVLQQFTARAAKALEKAQSLARERATVAYLEAANIVKARFLNTVSHELRTPLTSIIGFSSTLQNHWSRLGDGERREFVDEISDQGQKLGVIVERLLEAARAELQGIPVVPVAHDLRQSVIDGMMPYLHMDRPRMDVDLPEVPVVAEVDPFVVDQIVFNLVDNAIRYTQGMVRVSMEVHADTVVIRVSDSGSGVDPALLELVMDPFYRGEATVVGDEGKGLHIVRTLVESHGGRGEIESDSHGTRAAVVLPRRFDAKGSSRLMETIFTT